jgi:polar amino acid transport system permease protein
MIELLVGVGGYVLSEAFFIGALMTLALTLLAMMFGIILGLVAALMKRSRWRAIRGAAGFYIWLFRGTPVLLQLIFVYAALPQFGVKLSSFHCAVVALSLNEGAYMAEIIRAGIEAIRPGQWMAARVLGMRERQIIGRIVLPQATRIIIPPTGNQFIGMLKTSALASVVAVSDLMLVSQRVASANFDYVNTLVGAAVYYLGLTSIFSLLQARLERRLHLTEGARPARQRASEDAPAIPAARPLVDKRVLGPTVVEIEGLSKSYGGRPIINNLSLSIRQGETVVVIGPSGSGKSTLLRCIAGLEGIDAGRIRFGKQEFVTPARVLHEMRRDVGMVFQGFELFPHLTAIENIMLAPVHVRGISPEEARQRALQLLRRVNLLDRAGSYPEQLSGGQQQRIAIARALAMDPRLMLFDEPTSALDPEMINEVLDVMMGLVRDGMTLIVVTHEMGFARRAADRVVFVDEGVVIEDSHSDVVFSEARHPRTRRFLEKILL